jgi:hypothetical protein
MRSHGSLFMKMIFPSTHSLQRKYKYFNNIRIDRLFLYGDEAILEIIVVGVIYKRRIEFICGMLGHLI